MCMHNTHQFYSIYVFHDTAVGNGIVRQVFCINIYSMYGVPMCTPMFVQRYLACVCACVFNIC